MRELLDEVRATLRLPLTLAAWVCLTVVMAIAGPFGSYEVVPLLSRLVFWLVVTALVIVVVIIAQVWVYSRLGWREVWNGGIMTAAAATLVLTWPLHGALWRKGQESALTMPSLVELALFIFCMTLAFCAFLQGQSAEQADHADVPAPPLAGNVPRLVERLAPELQAPVLRVSGRDHYVDVVTTAGAGSLLMRFSDALAELDGAEGLRVHRSHWVAAIAVQGAAREGGRLMLQLTNGSTVPVSRTYMPEVEQRGWIPQM